MSEIPVVAQPRRRPLHPDITEELIQSLVHGFYADVRRDDMLGPIFDEAIGDHWDEHLEKLCAFWSSVAMMTGRYKGTPMQKHMALENIREAHFERWLVLWRRKTRELMPEEVAAVFIEAAERIGRSLQLGLFYRPTISVRASDTASGASNGTQCPASGTSRKSRSG